MTILDLPGHVFVVPGDVTQIRADAVVFSTSTALLGGGHLYGSFAARFPWFIEALARAVPEVRPGKDGCAIGHAFCLEAPGGQGPAVITVASTIDGRFGTTTRERLTRDDCAERAIRGALSVAHDYLKR